MSEQIETEDSTSLDAVYGQSLYPESLSDSVVDDFVVDLRGPSDLYNKLPLQRGIGEKSIVLDAGCAIGEHSCELAHLLGCKVIAVDPVDANIARTTSRVAEAGLTSKIEVMKAVVEDLPLPDGIIDLVWCRGLVPHLKNLPAAFGQFSRVLKRDGCIVLLTGFYTDLIEPAEAALLNRRLGLVAQSMSRPAVEAAFEIGGLRIVSTEEIGSEYAEHHELHHHRSSRRLTAIARLQRSGAAAMERYGQSLYEAALGYSYWHVYQMLGKISYQSYLLEKSTAEPFRPTEG